MAVKVCSGLLLPVRPENLLVLNVCLAKILYPLQRLLLQLLHKLINALELSGNLDVLRTVFVTFTTTDAVVCLAQFLYRAVVAHQEGTARFLVIGVLTTLCHIALVYALVVIHE